MENVQFNEPQYGAPVSNVPVKQSFLAKAVIGMGLAKDDAGAQKALIGVLVVVVLLTGFVIFTQFSGGGSAAPAPLPGDAMIP